MQESLQTRGGRGGAHGRFGAAALVMAAVAGGLVGVAQGQVNPLERTTPPPRPAGPAPAVPPPPAAAQPQAQEGPSFEVSAFVVRYPVEQPDRPAIEELLQLEVALSVFNGVYVSPREGGEQVTVRLEDLTSAQRGVRRFSVGAINAIGARIVRALNERGVIGVLVAPDPNQIDPQSLQDLRSPTARALNLDVWTRSVGQVRTLGSGPRWSKPTAKGERPSAENRINHPYHERIRENSPLQPAVTEPGQPAAAGDLLRREPLDEYLFRLNRHPGRRVDVAIAAGEAPGEVVLDYLVTENKPWTIYFQVSNTGTEETNEWRERIGFIHDQFMNRDDILSIDFITASFDEANALVASYDAPLGGSELLRAKVYGSFSEFTASEVGIADERFTGESWVLGGELSANVFQQRQTFVDAFAGVRWENHDVTNEAVQLEGRADFFIPYAGLRLERTTLRSSTGAEVRIEASLPDVAGTDEEEVQKLGRQDADDDWVLLRGGASHSFYLEPLLFGPAWSDPASPDRKTTLAHEVALSLRGQYAFGNRLIPQAEDVVGGMYSVRGYPESLVAGDTSVIASAEYRFHLPRALAIQPDPTKTPLFGRPFRFSPEQRYGRPDWDLILKGFVDAARVWNSDRLSFERDETLIGTGIGAELVFRRNLNVRVDWGFALEDAADVDAGDNRVHISATLLY